MSFFSKSTAEKPHILIVEDERHIGIGLKFNCEAEGYLATLVGDGLNALRLVHADPQQFDLIILDLMLPEMSGYKVLEEIRKANVQTPVMILSARTLSEDRTRGFDLGADQYLMKPFELPELLSRIRNLLQRRGHVPKPELQDDIYQFQGHVINFTRHEVTKNGESKSLTPLEFELLRYFVRNEGAVVTRAQLLDKVWGLDSSPTTRTVDNFILRLRRYFEQDATRPQHFLSIRGVGYRFVKEPASNPEIVADNVDDTGTSEGLSEQTT
ncbi:MAG: phoP 1 [Planctomycetaceae bacterium]|nr:phoP 1 [Planctomycetaceae bacterium]